MQLHITLIQTSYATNFVSIVSLQHQGPFGCNVCDHTHHYVSQTGDIRNSFYVLILRFLLSSDNFSTIKWYVFFFPKTCNFPVLVIVSSQVKTLMNFSFLLKMLPINTAFIGTFCAATREIYCIAYIKRRLNMLFEVICLTSSNKNEMFFSHFYDDKEKQHMKVNRELIYTTNVSQRGLALSWDN